MTTILGIRALKGGKGVVLVSDLNRTSVGWFPQGDYAVRRQEKRIKQKIYVDDDNRFAVAMSGVFDTFYQRFLGDILEGEINLEKVLKEGFFPELKALNELRWQGKMPDLENVNSLLIASNYGGEPSLYTCFPLGVVEQRDYTSIGSGSNYALDYIHERGDIIPRRISLDEAIDLGVGALANAERDIYTGGMDVCVVLPEKIKSYGDFIKSEMMKAKKEIISRIKAENSS